ncbi:ATP-binding cassette domain-containing protein [Corynebacteriaceae bacterium 7-707]
MITVEHLSKRYREVTAVDDVTFTVPNGVITGFLGPNGAGKSTTMRAILGLDRPTSGTALIDGLPLSGHDRPATAAGAVLDTSWFHPGRTGLAHLQITAVSAGLPVSSAQEALAAVGMTAAGHRRIGAYSLGMKQRLGIATAMLGRPQNIILDEPMNGLDPQGMEWIRTYLRSLSAQGHAVLISSHLLTEMETLADRLVIIGQGRLLGEWETADLILSHGSAARISTNDNARLATKLSGLGVTVIGDNEELSVTFDETIPDTTALAHVCRKLDVLITALSKEPARLEDLFLQLTAASSDYTAGEK